MSKPRDSRHKDLFRPALDQIIDLGHPLVRLAEEIEWDFLDRRFASVCTAGPGQPPLPSRLVAGLLIPAGKIRDLALARRDNIARRMTDREICEAEVLGGQWMPKTSPL